MVGTVVLSDLSNQRISFAKNFANRKFPARAICEENQKDVFFSSQIDEENQIPDFDSQVVACAISPADFLQWLMILSTTITFINNARNFVKNIIKDVKM